METQLVNEFVSKTGSSPDDALSCLKTWGWDLKKALIDYNGKTINSNLPISLHFSLTNQNKDKVINSIVIADTSTTEYFNGRTGLKVSMDTVDFANGSTLTKSSPQQIHLRKPSLTKLDSIDVIDCKLGFVIRSQCS